MEFLKKRLSLIVAIIFAGISSLGLFHYLENRESVSVANPAKPMAMPIAAMQVVVSANPLIVGHKITEADLATLDWPKQSISEEHFQTKAQLIGRVLNMDVIKNEPITAGKLLPEGESLSNLIPEDMRAVTVQIRRSDTLLQVLQRGSFVDVIAIVEGNEANPNRSTKVVAHSVKVMTVNAPGNEKNPDPNMEVVLLVKNHDAGQILAATNGGNIELVVRNQSKPVLEVF